MNQGILKNVYVGKPVDQSNNDNSMLTAIRRKRGANC